MGPHAGEPLEVRGAVAGAQVVVDPTGRAAVGLVAPEAQGHRRERSGAHQLAALADRGRRSGICPHVDGHPQRRTLDLTGVDGSGRVPEHEAAAQVGPSRDGGQVQAVGTDPGGDGVHHPLEALRRQRRTRRGERPQRGEVGPLPRAVSGVAHRVDELGRHAEQVDTFRGRQLPQPLGAGVGGVAVVQDDRRPRRRHRRQPVPHHPAARREVQDPVAGTDVEVQLLLLGVGEQHPAAAVHDALGHPGGPGAEQHVPRVVERQRLELDHGAPERFEPVVPGGGRSRNTRQVGVVAEERNHHDLPERRQPLEDRGQLRGAVEVPAAVGVAVGRDQDRRGDLGEPVEHPVGSEVR